MTEPGNLNNAIPRSTDWIPRELTDLRRQIRRGASGTPGVVTGTVNGTQAVSISRTNPGEGNSDAALGAVAIGDLATAHGVHAIAIGRDTSTHDDYAIRVGFAGSAYKHAISIGTQAAAIGEASIALGEDASASATKAVAIGIGAAAETDLSIAVGWDADVSGDFGIAIGNGAQSAAQDACAIGGGSHATGVFALALGSGAVAGANGAAAIGVDSGGAAATTSTANEFVLGTANHIVIVKGKLVIRDGSGGLHQIVVSTGGALSTVAYP